MNRKILILIMAVILAVSIPVFAEESATTTDPGIKPDSPLYILDKLAEKIQIAIITDAVKEAEALAGMAQERLAESKAMVEINNIEKATAAINEYTELMDKAIDVIDAAAKDGKAVNKTIDMIAKYDMEDEAILEKLMDKVPAEYREDLKKAIEALPEKEAVKPEDDKEKEEQAEKVSAANAILTGKIQDKALLEKIEAAGLNNRQIAALVSLSEQSEKDLNDVVDLFLLNSKGIGKTIMELNLAPKDAMKDINKTFKELKKEIKTGLVNSEELDKETEEKDSTVEEDKDDEDADKNDDSDKKDKESAKLEKKLDKATEKLEKKIEQSEKKYE
ncbi:MAG TPA: DUF5667 domain-containing protein, partial [Patescibacteria group bacterium]|nr:DUF5667 domain-containing protein [Patescibacteria group bacterium]